MEKIYKTTWLLGGVFFLFLFYNGYGQQSCDMWGSSFGSQSHDMGYDIKTHDGFVYVCGRFSDTLQFESGTELVSSGGTDIFVAKFTLDGALEWAQRAGGSLNERAQELCIDSWGNIVITGDFEGTATFGNTVLESNGSFDIFTSKLSQSGEFIWAVSYGGPGIDNGRALTIGKDGSIYTLGYFYETAQFGQYQLTSYGSNDIVIIKQSPDGDVLWLSHHGGYLDDDPRSIVEESDGNLLICGYFKDRLFLQGTSQSIWGIDDKDAFWLRIDKDGNCIGGDAFGGCSVDVAERIVVDSDGDFYIGGIYSSGFIFAAQQVPHYGLYDSFVCKFDKDGNKKWLRFGSGYGDDFSIGLDISEDDVVYVTGYFSDQALFNDTVLYSEGQKDVFVVSYSKNGERKEIKSFGGIGDDMGWGICVSDGNWYLTGSFENDLLIGGNQLVSSGSSDVLLAGSGLTFQDVNFEWVVNGLGVAFQLTGVAPDSVFWSFGDGSFSTQINPYHLYPYSGKFDVKCLGYFPCNTDSIIQTVVLCEMPKPHFSYETSELTVYYDNSLTIADSVFWRFGDGSYSCEDNPVHVFRQSGIYFTCLLAYNDCGVDSICSMIHLCDSMTASFSYMQQGSMVAFKHACEDYSELFWDFGDGFYSTDENPVHTYSDEGAFIVFLFCINACDTLTAVDTIMVCQPPQALFSHYYSGELTYQFINESTGFLNILWDFGDGSYSNELNPEHTFMDWEIYTVTLLVENECGYDTSMCQINIPTDVFKPTNDDIITYQYGKGGELTVCYRKPLQAGQHLILYDLSGNPLYHDVMKNITHIPVVGFKGGLYILKVASNNGEKMATRKILIQ